MTMTIREFLYRMTVQLPGPVPDDFGGPMPDGGPARIDLSQMGGAMGALGALAGSRGPRKEPTITSAEALMRTDLTEPVWAVDGLLADGVTLLAGSPKLGKSWLAMELVLCVSRGEPFLGLGTTQGPALYLALEDGQRRLRRRLPYLLRRRKTGPRDAHFATSWPRLDEGGLDALSSWCDEHSPRIVVIDTWAKVRPDAGFFYSGDYSAIEDVQVWAEERAMPVVLITHVTKSAAAKPTADPLAGISGSTGLIGAVDNVLMLTRGRGEGGGRLYVTGRDVAESATDLAFDLAHGVWEPVAGFGETVDA